MGVLLFLGCSNTPSSLISNMKTFLSALFLSSSLIVAAPPQAPNPSPWIVQPLGGSGTGGIPIAGTGINVVTNGNNTYTISATGESAATNVFYTAAGFNITIVTNIPNYLYTLSISNLHGSVITANTVNSNAFNSATWFAATNQSYQTNINVLYISPDGDDTKAIKGVKHFPYLTIQSAITNADAGDTIYFEAGIHSIGTYSIELPDNVNIAGLGTIFSSADLQSDGACIVPGNNSIIEDITIECDKATLIADYDVTHTGYWAAIGSYNQGGFTNVTIRNIKVKNAMSDVFFVLSVNKTEANVFSSQFHGYWDHSVVKGNQGHIWKYTGCRFFAEGPNPIPGLGASGRIVASDAGVDSGSLEFAGCSFLASNFANSAIFRVLGGSVKVSGCVAENYPTVASVENWDNLTGNFVYNGTNYNIGTSIADANGMTNYLTANLIPIPLTNGDQRSITFSNATGVTTLKFTAGFGATAPVFQTSSMDFANGYAINVDGTLNLTATRFAFDGTADFTGLVSGSFEGNGGLLTNLISTNFVYSTNTLASIVLDLTKSYSWYPITTNTTLTGVTGKIHNQIMHSVLMITNGSGSDRTLTLPTEWRTSDGLRTYYVTNGQMAILSVNCFGNMATNAVCINTW